MVGPKDGPPKDLKDKVRKRGKSLQRKTLQLGQLCDVFTALLYWNPTHARLEQVVHVPDGQSLPDLVEHIRHAASLQCQSTQAKPVDERQSPPHSPPRVRPQRACVNPARLSPTPSPLLDEIIVGGSDTCGSLDGEPGDRTSSLNSSGPALTPEGLPISPASSPIPHTPPVELPADMGNESEQSEQADEGDDGASELGWPDFGEEEEGADGETEDCLGSWEDLAMDLDLQLTSEGASSQTLNRRRDAMRRRIRRQCVVQAAVPRFKDLVLRLKDRSERYAYTSNHV